MLDPVLAIIIFIGKKQIVIWVCLKFILDRFHSLNLKIKTSLLRCGYFWAYSMEKIFEQNVEVFFWYMNTNKRPNCTDFGSWKSIHIVVCFSVVYIPKLFWHTVNSDIHRWSGYWFFIIIKNRWIRTLAFCYHY